MNDMPTARTTPPPISLTVGTGQVETYETGEATTADTGVWVR